VKRSWPIGRDPPSVAILMTVRAFRKMFRDFLPVARIGLVR
jgi:hypothetical protein